MSTEKKFLSFRFKVEKAEDDGKTGYMAGLMSVFNNVDQGDDMVMPGAFARTIQNKRGVFPMLLDHNPSEPAGYMMNTRETDKGLAYEAEIPLHDPRVKQRYELAKLSLKLDSPMGNSIGYATVKSDFKQQDDRTIRLLKELKLYEGSLVTFPMNEAAGVTGAKAQDLAGLIALMQSGRYDLEAVKKALEAIDRDAGNARLATKQTDPELLHSVDNMIRTLRA